MKTLLKVFSYIVICGLIVQLCAHSALASISAPDTSNEVVTETNNIVSTIIQKDFPSTVDPQILIGKNTSWSFSTFFKNLFGATNYSLKETIKIIVTNPKKIIIDPSQIKFYSNTNDELQITIDNETLVPGEYEVEIIDTENNERITQSFSWGVLAINSNKSLYTVGDTAQLTMAVLDQEGAMVCDADVTLQIKTPNDEIYTFSTQSGTVQVTPQCKSKKLSLIPDYLATQIISQVGTYQLTLSATTKNGTYTISDSFSAEPAPNYDIERITATRIYPLQKYPVTIKFTPKTDFSGFIVESVPNDFKITSTTQLNIEIKDNRQLIYWPVTVQANQTVSLNYEYDAPDISPELFNIGQIQITDIQKQPIYQESRIWQIASDNIFSSVTFTNVGSTNWTVPTNVYSIVIEAWGAGGGGGDGTNNGGGGGGGGAYAASTMPVTPGTIYNIVVGLGGTSARAAGGTGTKGGDSTFNGTTVSAIGGNGGTSTTGGTGGLAATSIGSTKFSGGNGGTPNTSNDCGGGGGGSAGPSGVGLIGSNGSTTIGGTGGTGNNGLGGAGGAGGNATNGTPGTANALGGGGGGGGDNATYGADGGAVGAGGGGGESQSTSVNGNGANGKVYISYYINEVPVDPTNSTPSNGATNISVNPTLTSSAFSDPDVADTHANSQWQIATDTGFASVVWDSGITPTNLTSIVANGTNGTFSGALAGQTSLANSTTYYWHVRHQDNRGNWTLYSTPYFSLTTSAAPTGNTYLKINGLKINGLKFK